MTTHQHMGRPCAFKGPQSSERRRMAAVCVLRRTCFCLGLAPSVPPRRRPLSAQRAFPRGPSRWRRSKGGAGSLPVVQRLNQSTARLSIGGGVRGVGFRDEAASSAVGYPANSRTLLSQPGRALLDRVRGPTQSTGPSGFPHKKAHPRRGEHIPTPAPEQDRRAKRKSSNAHAEYASGGGGGGEEGVPGPSNEERSLQSLVNRLTPRSWRGRWMTHAFSSEDCWSLGR